MNEFIKLLVQATVFVLAFMAFATLTGASDVSLQTGLRIFVIYIVVHWLLERFVFNRWHGGKADG